MIEGSDIQQLKNFCAYRCISGDLQHLLLHIKMVVEKYW